MPKLLKILAASVGGGLVLGAGIRLGEAIMAQYPAPPGPNPKLAERLGELEQRLSTLESEGSGVAGPPFERHAAEVSALRTHIEEDNRQVDALGEASVRLRGELRGWLEESVSTRIAAAEACLKGESERGQKQLLDAFAESVQTRVIQRISKLEDEVAGQSAAMTELRECSFRTELSMQKLLGSLDKLLIRNPPEIASVEERTPAPPATVPQAPGENAAPAAPETSAPPAPETPKPSPFTIQSLVSGPFSVPAAEPETAESETKEQTAAAPEPPSFTPPHKPSRWKLFG